MTQYKVTDQLLSAKLNELKLEHPTLLCQTEKKVSRICINPLCENSMMCAESDCEKCKKTHITCPSVSLEGITLLLNQRVAKYVDFVERSLQIENKFTNEMQENRNKLIKQYHLGTLEKDYLTIVNELYSNESSKTLNGKQSRQFYQRIEKERNDAVKRSTILLDEYEKSLKELFSKIANLQERLYEEFSKQITIDSEIVDKNHEKREEYLQFMREKLNYPLKLQLLFRASENKFDVSKFHKKCDDVPNTLTLAKTQFGHIIGGFSPYTWNAKNKDYLNDNERKSFLLSFDLKQKMVPLTHERLIYCHPSYGPCFGQHDLYIADHCNQNNNSKSEFPTSYNCEEEQKMEKNQKLTEKFCGASQSTSFKVLEYEIFKVSFDKQQS